MTLKRVFTYANVMSTIAAFAALSTGGAWAAKAITGKQIKDNSIESRDIRNSQVFAADLRSASVTAAKLATGAVGSAAVADGSLTGADIADGSLGTSDLAPGTLTLADGAVTAAKLAPGSVTPDKFAADITSAEIDALYTYRAKNDVARVTGNPVNIPNGAPDTFSVSAQCPLDTSIVGGGIELSQTDHELVVLESYPDTTGPQDVWSGMVSTDGTPPTASATAYALCINS
jgi:hypothetical protein